MSSWGASTSDESKPKYLTDAEKRNCYATDRGWTIPAGGNPDGEREVIATIGGLSGAAKLAAGTISSTRFVTTTLGAAAGGAFSVEVVYNEAVDVTGTPLLTVTNETDAARNVVCEYASGTGTNRLTFTKTVATNATTDADVLAVQANAVTTAGTIKDAGTNVDSARTHLAQSATTKITVDA
jgi:hypothetical protein